jgi:hypothetical protein
MRKALKKSETQLFTRQEVLELLENLAFHYSDNGDPDTDVAEWFESRYPSNEVQEFD